MAKSFPKNLTLAEIQQFILDNSIEDDSTRANRPELNLEKPCRLWTRGVLLSGGYGRLYQLGEQRAHRVSYRVFKLDGLPIPEKLMVCHKCDVPNCIEPEHFFLGTNKDNMHDRDAKGRNAVSRAEVRAQISATKKGVSIASKGVAKSVEHCAALSLAAKNRRCGICKERGHHRSKCPRSSGESV